MDPFHQRLTRVALGAAARYGFCLAGGYAVQAHGFVDRASKDVDLFTTMAAAADFPAAQAAVVVVALRDDGLEVTVEREGPSFARLAVAGWPLTTIPDSNLRSSPKHSGPFDDFPASAFEPYKLTPVQVDGLVVRLLAWADDIDRADRQ